MNIRDEVLEAAGSIMAGVAVLATAYVIAVVVLSL